MWLLNAAFVACPLVWIGVAVVGVIVGIVLLVRWIKGLASSTTSFGDRAKAVFSIVWNWIKSVGSAIASIFAPLKGVFKQIWVSVKTVFGSLVVIFSKVTDVVLATV